MPPEHLRRQVQRPEDPVHVSSALARRLREKVAAMIRRPEVATNEKAVHVLVMAVDPKLRHYTQVALLRAPDSEQIREVARAWL